ncbi:MAG: c-type cytochrome [Gammaproteobacteria bacterium]|jgi:sulfide dehydrogenase cytochrome subunit|nr:c-type cytochrome [Gammaproteobacteria bacterium]
MRRLLRANLILLAAFAFASEVQASEITRAVMLSNSCAACHGTDGNSPGAMPSINGKSAQFISRALLEFREGKREATVMGRHASGYSDDEIQLIADYFSTLP